MTHTEESLMTLAFRYGNARFDCGRTKEGLEREAAYDRMESTHCALLSAIRKVLAERDSCAEQIAEAVDQRDRQARRAERAEAECERLRKLLLRSKRGHYYCEDSWYSCPKEPESGCADESQGTECNCGADEWNAEIDAAMQEGK